jgi:hypothetical protein
MVGVTAVCIILKHKFISKKTQRFFVTKISWLMLFKEIIADCSENHTKHINKYSGQNRVTDGYSWWYICLPLGFRGLNLKAPGDKESDFNTSFSLLNTSAHTCSARK